MTLRSATDLREAGESSGLTLQTATRTEDSTDIARSWLQSRFSFRCTNYSAGSNLPAGGIKRIRGDEFRQRNPAGIGKQFAG